MESQRWVLSEDPGDQDDNTDIEDGDGNGGNPSPGHGR